MKGDDFIDLPIFRNLGSGAISAIRGVMIERVWNINDPVIEQGAYSDGVHLVLEGSIQIIFTTEKGPKIKLAQLNRGDMFGVLSCIDGGLRGASCIATKACRTMFLQRTDFLELMEGSSALALGFQIAALRSIYYDIRRTNEMFSEMRSLDPISKKEDLVPLEDLTSINIDSLDD
jgi:CRP/FNR family transcriptional regulator, cyclic AMP receptor protein